jgi:hypothetical protein
MHVDLSVFPAAAPVKKDENTTLLCRFGETMRVVEDDD